MLRRTTTTSSLQDLLLDKSDKSTELSPNLSPTSVSDVATDFEIGSGFEFKSAEDKECDINIEAEQHRSATLITMMLVEKRQRDASHRSRFFTSNKNNVNNDTPKPDACEQKNYISF